MRNIKTEYVSCPSCGRTLFDLQEVTEQIRTRTGHLPGEHSYLPALCTTRCHTHADCQPQSRAVTAADAWLWQLP